MSFIFTHVLLGHHHQTLFQLLDGISELHFLLGLYLEPIINLIFEMNTILLFST